MMDLLKYNAGVWDELLTPRYSTRSLQPLDIVEEDKNYVISTNVPGFSKEDIDISVENNELVIKSIKSEEKTATKKNYIHRERRSHNFSRSIALTEKISIDQIKATLNNGVLEVTIPKKAEKEVTTKKINIL